MKSFEAVHFSHEELVIHSYSSGRDSSKPVLLLLHGAPGSASAFKRYLSDSLLKSHFEVIAVDRPGYGKSRRGTYVDIKTQTLLLQRWMEIEYSNREVYVFGHSYGATIAALLTVYAPNPMKKAILFAPALDPEEEKYFPLGKLTVYPFSKWLFPSSWRVAGAEKYQHATELKGLANVWSGSVTPSLYVHGDADKIVPYSNLSYAKRRFPASVMEFVTLKEEGHLGVFTRQKGVVDLMYHYFSEGIVLDHI